LTIEANELGVPEDALRRLAEMKPGQRTTLFTSDLSVNEFLLVREAGFRPLGLVLGSSIYHVGFQMGRWSKPVPVSLTPWSPSTQDFDRWLDRRLTALYPCILLLEDLDRVTRLKRLLQSC
jgi:hypothetical protein